MNIVVVNLEGEISTTISSYEERENAKQVQEEIKEIGGKEKVIAFLQLPKDDNLDNLLSALCAFSDGLEGSIQYDFEDLLTKTFQLGHKYGFNSAKRKLQRNIRKIIKI